MENGSVGRQYVFDIVVAIVGDGVSPGFDEVFFLWVIGQMEISLLHEEADFYFHLHPEYVEEVVLRLDDWIPRQCPFTVDIRLTEPLLGEGQLAVFIGLPQDFRPMHGRCVDSAAVVEYEGFDVVHILFFV